MPDYVPVLKSKQTTFRALSYLKEDTLNSIRPYIQLLPGDDPCTKLISFWPDQKPMYFDFSFIELEETLNLSDVINHIVQTCRNAGKNIIPVWSPTNTSLYFNTINELIQNGASEIGIRIPLDNITPENCDRVINRSLTAFPLENTNLHVFLDLGDISDGNNRRFAVDYVLSRLHRPDFSFFCIVGGAFPNSNDLQSIRNAITMVPRYDYSLWKSIKESGTPHSQNLCYGDFTIRNPEIPYGQGNPHLIPTLRYTIDADFYINRGISRKKHDRGMNQYNDECTDLISQNYFRGPDFSYGDREISAKGTNPDSSSGNPGTWAEIGINQHIEFVVSQLSSQP